ncbi:hypothetical protein [Streptomyces tremellae]|uniref:Uncharacterized protein n=1 Tax=Streptomyces tremellae TaxID=1124239 RepID=A0ABP7EKX5_9ACTN
MTGGGGRPRATAVVRLVTRAELDTADSAARRISVSARLVAVLADGRRVVLLDDRGWSASGPAGTGLRLVAEEVERDARTVVGPDEPFGGRTRAQMAADHWGSLARVLARRGVAVDAAELARLPHDVVLGERLRARLG